MAYTAIRTATQVIRSQLMTCADCEWIVSSQGLLAQAPYWPESGRDGEVGWGRGQGVVEGGRYNTLHYITTYIPCVICHHII